jgi:hypothetical protein
MTVHSFLGVLLLFTCGCGGTFANAGRDAAQGATNALAENRSTIDLLAESATAHARDALLNPKTTRDLETLTDRLVLHLGHALDIQETLLFANAEKRLPALLRLSIDEALGENTGSKVANLRDEAFGRSLQTEIGEALDTATPHLAALVSQATLAASTTATTLLDAEVVKLRESATVEIVQWKHVAEAFAAGVAVLLLLLVVIASYLRKHAKAIASLREESFIVRGRARVTSQSA